MEKLKRILVATDFSSFSQEALDYAVYLNKELGGELYVLHVFQEPLTLPSAETFNVKKMMNVVQGRSKGSLAPEISQWMFDVREEEGKRLAALVESLGSQVENVTPIFKTGVPFSEIIKTAKDIDAHLLILGTHGRTGMAHFLMGSVAEKVVRLAPCPVLTLRPKGMKPKIEDLEEKGYWG
ncbi:MAG TPA: universal stress protein [Nitrospiria bacterium]|jgi:nucleotide-binding universal stress UspA family protein